MTSPASLRNFRRSRMCNLRLPPTARRARECRLLFPGYFEQETVLVPVPTHAPGLEGALWPAHMISEALVSERLARRCETILRRARAVEKSSTSTERRTVSRQIETIEAAPPIDYPARIVVVDDVVTSGATLFATTRLIRDACPTADVRAFALIRTLSGQEVPETRDQCLAPCTGTIGLNPDDTTIRHP